MGQIARNYPSRHAYIASDDCGYVSASDEEDEYVLAANHDAGDDNEDSGKEAIDIDACSAIYQSIFIQCVLSVQVEQMDKLQCHNSFHTFLVIIKDCRIHAIFDGWSSNNLVSLDLVKNIGLTTRCKVLNG